MVEGLKRVFLGFYGKMAPDGVACRKIVIFFVKQGSTILWASLMFGNLGSRNAYFSSFTAPET